MLTVANVSKAFGGRVLFEGADLQLNRGDRVGLVGPNGAGKSTLFSIILGREEPDDGQVVFERGTRAGYLPQESAPAGDESVLEMALGIGHGAGSGAVDHVHVDHQTEARAKRILKGLAFRENQFDRRAREFSGGWVMRAHLARLLVDEPDVLMLDEPTNHLDLSALLWVQDYLRSYPGAILLISHDREFLNQLVGSVVELRQGRLWRYRGNYDSFLEQKDAVEAQQMAAYKNQQREIARLMNFVDRFRAKNTKATQAQSKLKQIERMDKIEAPSSTEASIDFRFPQPPRSGHRVISLKGVRHAYGENVVYENLEFQAERGQRIVLVGPNGAGKSTLLKLLAEAVPVQSGERLLGHNVRSGYYAQYRVEMLNPSRTVLEEALDTPQRVTEQSVRSILGCFLFRGDDVFKRVSVLSGGEKSRLALVKLLLDPPNLLLMDEPTTHLDMASIEALTAALDPFEGTLIFISHDVHFIRSLANHVVHVEHGKLAAYPGDYDYYRGKVSEREKLEARMIESASAKSPVKAERPAEKSKDQKRLEAEARQARSKERKAKEEQVRELERTIARLEKRQTELETELNDPAILRDPRRLMNVRRDLGEVAADLAHATEEWEKAAHALEALVPGRPSSD